MSNIPQESKQPKTLWDWFIYAAGFYKNPVYIEDKLKEADVRSSLYLSIAVIGMEIWMLLRYVKKYVITGKCATVSIFFKYTNGYWILLISSIILAVYGLLYMKGKLKRLKKYSRIIIFLYFSIGIYFGIKTSLHDFTKGRMITCFLSMCLYATFIFVVRPYISLFLMSATGIGFIVLINQFAVDESGAAIAMESGDLVNYITFFISLTVLYMTIYFQRYGDAQKAYKLENAAITDSVTNAPNINRMDQQYKTYIKECTEKGKTPVYLAFNIKNFQIYNDRYGYDEGDKLLTETAGILKQIFKDDPYARHSADKFLVLTCADTMKENAEKVKTALQAAHPAETYLDIAFGAYKPENGDDEPRHAMDYAQYAMKLMKNREDIMIAEYDEKCRKNYEVRNYVLNNLDTAIKEGYITAYYQPVMDARDGCLCGCEALARWIDPQKGLLSPAHFVSVLEDSRQIHKLDKCIYETVLKKMRESLDAGLPILPVSLNFSRLDFELMDAVKELETLIAKYNIPKEYVHVEITESALTEDEEGLKSAIHQLHEKGYAVWLDDFGSGYSSMNVLKDYKFDLLKIDMVFLRGFSGNKNARAIIKSIIDLADQLDMDTLTEGVESDDAVSFLKEAGCGRLQGYYYGKPQTYEELSTKIADGTYQISSFINQKTAEPTAEAVHA